MQNISEIRNKWFIFQVEALKNKGVTLVEIADKLDIKPQYLTPIMRGDRNASEKFVSKFCEKFNINHNDLLSLYKRHDMSTDIDTVSEPNIRFRVTKDIKSIPLIPIDAVAGIGIGDNDAVMPYDIADHYLVPEFTARGVQFLIRVSGSSMYPKYSNGDILACKRITDTSFFQWGKVYVLDTDQGALVKRLFEGNDNNTIECRSDNKEHYPPFELSKTSIRGVSIVVGVIRLE